jgi:hypothetical protein
MKLNESLAFFFKKMCLNDCVFSQFSYHVFLGGNNYKKEGKVGLERRRGKKGGRRLKRWGSNNKAKGFGRKGGKGSLEISFGEGLD